MKILSECNLAQIVVDILAGKTMVFPTETSYGLGCDATNQKSVDQIYKIKQRQSDKPLLVVVPTIEMAKEYLVWNDLVDQIAKKYWPGAVTVVGEYKVSGIKYQVSKLASGVVSRDNTVAVRVTSHPLLKSITEKIGKPLVATSANISDQGEIYNAKEIIKIFSDQTYQPDIILNYGELAENKPTTIVSVLKNNLKILRQGGAKIEI